LQPKAGFGLGFYQCFHHGHGDPLRSRKFLRADQ
jgi:hypothetical protein